MEFETHKRFEVASISLQGASHIDKNIPVQDSSLCYVNGSNCFIAVSDGHGSAIHFRSNLGSSFAVEAAKRAFLKDLSNNSILKNKEQLDKFCLNLENDIYYLWLNDVQNDLNRFAFEEDERFLSLNDDEKEKVRKNPIVLYGCTLICSFSTDRYVFILKIGDGNVVVIGKDNEALQLNQLEDESNQLNKTASLCSSDALIHFRYCLLDDKQNKPKAVLLFSDGVINSFSKPEMLIQFSKNILTLYAQKGKKQTIKLISEALNKFSFSGSGDDVSCAFVINKNKVLKR